MSKKPIYKLIDSRGRVLIPKELRNMARMDYGDIVRLELSNGNVNIQKVNIVEVGDKSPEAVEAYVRSALKVMPNHTRLSLITELTKLLEIKEN